MRRTLGPLVASLILAACMETSPFQGPLLVVTTEIDEPVAMVIRGDWIYIASYDWDTKEGIIGRVDRDGGDFHVLTRGTENLRPRALTLDETHVYWTVNEDNGGNLGEVWRIPLEGGDAQLIAGDQTRPCGVAVDASTVFWRSRPSTQNGTIEMHAWSKSGATELLVPPYTWNEDGGGEGCEVLAVPDPELTTATKLYYANEMGGGPLYRLTWNGSQMAGNDCKLVQCGGNNDPGDYQGDPGMIVVGDEIYWVVKGSGICRAPMATACPVSSSTPPPQAQQLGGESRPAALASDGLDLYFVRGAEYGSNNDGDLSNGRVLRTDLGLTKTHTVSPFDGSPRGVAVDEEYVYWGDDGRIFKTPK